MAIRVHIKLPYMLSGYESRIIQGIEGYRRKTRENEQKKGLDTVAYRVRCQLKHASQDCTIFPKRCNGLDRKKCVFYHGWS